MNDTSFTVGNVTVEILTEDNKEFYLYYCDSEVDGYRLINGRFEASLKMFNIVKEMVDNGKDIKPLFILRESEYVRNNSFINFGILMYGKRSNI